MRRIVVTGATGTVGGAAMRLLAAAGVEAEVLGAARSDRAAEALRAQGHRPVRLEYEAAETLRAPTRCSS
jgi:NAD(P)H dehydrogenase (quinone)